MMRLDDDDEAEERSTKFIQLMQSGDKWRLLDCPQDEVMMTKGREIEMTQSQSSLPLSSLSSN